MDNLTHSLVGLVAAKSGLERLSPAATPLCILAANSPDSDLIVLLFADRWTFLHHHRGITHAIVGVVCLAVILPLLFYAGDRLLAKLRGRPPQIKFRGLLIASLIVSATHPILDWTNNYGIRFFLPWDNGWSYGDLVFIVDPLIWLVLGGTAFLLTSRTRLQRVLWSLLAAAVTALVILAPRAANHPNPMLLRIGWVVALVILTVVAVSSSSKRVGPRLGWIALAVIVSYWGILAVVHSFALNQAHREALSILQGTDESIVSLAVMPTLANPAGWDCVFETDRATYRMSVSLLGEYGNRKVISYLKPQGREAQLTDFASTDRRTQILLEFARYPVWRVTDPGCTTQTLVQLADLRYTEPGRTRGSFSLELPVECSTPPVIANDE
jgi:inner membrane protein